MTDRGTLTPAERVCAEFGDNVRAERNRLGLKQAELAEMADLSQYYISRVETGKASPSLPTVIALARALEVGASELIGDGWTEVEDE